MRLLRYWNAIRSSFWFVPAVMAAAATALALGGVAVDEAFGDDWVEGGWIYAGGPEGARAVLSVIASSTITVAGVVFSITTVTLSLASSQFGPRLLRNFIRDTANQVVLGTFTATFLYCLLVMRTIRSVEENAFVPHLSVTVGVLLAVVGVGVLIYFIHHVAVSIQVAHVVHEVGQELAHAIDRLHPDPTDGDAETDATLPPAAPNTPSRPVRSTAEGYLQAVDHERLVRAAASRNVLIRTHRRPGRFVFEDSVLADVSTTDATAGHDAPVDDELAAEINAAFVLGPERTPDQDIEFAIEQLVEIAVRALSPGINDPFTAINCIDSLAAGLRRLARKPAPRTLLRDDDGRVRLLLEAPTFEGAVDAAFDQIRQAARGNAAVTIRLLEAIAETLECARTDPARSPLLRQAALVHDAAQAIPDPADRADATHRYNAALTAAGRTVDSHG